MNGRSNFFSVLVLLCVLVLIVLQVMTMIQSDRLYVQLNRIAEKLHDGGQAGPAGGEPVSADSSEEMDGE